MATGWLLMLVMMSMMITLSSSCKLITRCLGEIKCRLATIRFN